MADTHIIYVPRPGLRHTIAPASAIVASLEAALKPMIVAHYEGNLWGAENLKDFGSRVMIAAGRQADRYPTIAFQAFDPANLLEVGRYDHATFKVTSLSNPEALRVWLGDQGAWVDAFCPA